MFSSFADLTLWQILTRLAAFLIITSLHGYVLAALIRLSGDPTPAYSGRLTIEPFRHLASWGLVCAVLFKLGWIVPMPVDVERLRSSRIKLARCVLGSLLAVLALVPLFSLLRPLAVTSLSLLTAQMVLAILDAAQDLAIWFVVLNIFPLPPLTGFLLLRAFAPTAADWLNRKPKIAEIAMVVLVVAGVVSVAIGPLNKALRLIVIY